MTLVNIDLRNQGYETSPGDKVVFYSLLVREGDFGTISTAPVEVPLVDGKATVDLAPGPVGVQIIAGQVADTRVKEGRVPTEGPTTLSVVLTLFPEYSDAIRAQFLAAIRGAQDEALTRIDAEVAVAVDAEMGGVTAMSQEALSRAKNAEGVAATSNTKSTLATSTASTAISTASNAVTRVTALEALGGLSPESPVDGQTANLVAQPGTLTAAALTKKFAVAEVVGQPDYVSLMAARSAYSKMSVTKIDNGSLNIRCASEDDEHSVIYTLTGPDRYRVIGLVRGTATGTAARIVTVEELDLQGNYLGQVPGSTWLTTEVGATWSVEITTSDSSDVWVRHYVDNRGGVWRISVDGHPELSATVSTWRENAGASIADLFTIPTPGTYTIRGEFIGEDPENPPSTGNARGWLTSVDRDFLSASNAGEGTQLVDLSPASNKDFAFMMRPAGTEANYEYVPYHGTASEVFASPTKYYVAGSPLDVDDLPVNVAVPIENFEVVQHIYGRNSSAPDPTQNIAEFWTTQKILADGTCHVSGRWRALVDLEMHNGAYPMMLPGYLEIFDEVISSVGTAHAVSGDNTPRNIRLTDEQDLAEGYAMLSSTSDFVAAVHIDARRETLRAGASDKSDNMAWIELRSGGSMAKVYQSIFALGAVVPAGQMHRFSGRLWYGAAPGMRSVLSLS